MGPNRGRFRVIVDGVPGPAIDLYGSVIASRQVVWSIHFESVGAHRIGMLVLSNRNTASSGSVVELDAFAGISPVSDGSTPAAISRGDIALLTGPMGSRRVSGSRRKFRDRARA